MKHPVWLQTAPEGRRRLVMLGIVLLAALLRMQQVNQPYVDAFAWREADTASMADAFAAGHWNIFQPQVRWGGPGPNYIGAEFQTVSFIAALGYQVFGAAPWVGRMVSIAFGLWGLFALHQLLRRVWGTSAALAAAAVMAVMPGSVFIERSFLSDGAMTSLMTTSLWMFVAYGQTRQQLFLALAALAGSLGCLTKLTGGILVLPALYAAWALLGDRLRERPLQIRLACAALLAALPVALYYAWARHLAASAAPYHFTGGGKFLWDGAAGDWLREGFFLPQFWHLVSTDLWSLPLIVFALLGLCLRPPAGEPGGARWLMHAWLVAMVIRYLIEARHLVMDPYNIHLFNPVVAAFAGLGLMRLTHIAVRLQLNRPRAALLSLMFSSAALAGAAIGGRMLKGDRYVNAYQDHLVLGRAVAELSHPQDLVISLGLEPVVLYHSRRNGWVFPPEEIANMHGGAPPYARDYGVRDAALLHQLKGQGARWLVLPSFNSYLQVAGLEGLRQDHPELYRGLLADFSVVREGPAGLILRAR